MSAFKEQWCQAHGRLFGMVNVSVVPIAAVPRRMIGDAASAADHVRNRRNRVDRSNIDLLSYLDRVVDLDAKVANGAFDLRMSQ